MPETDLVADHKALDDDAAARRYFAKFERITGHLAGVAEAMQGAGALSPAEAEVTAGYLAALSRSFAALSLKYLIAGRLEGSGRAHLTIDLHESGFPVFQEIATLATDAAQVARHLDALPDAARLKDEMVRQIVSERTVPVRLQYAMSQRLYFETLAVGGLFLPQLHPEGRWLEDLPGGRRRMLVHWAVYDSQQNVPVLYLMEAEDAGRKPIVKDQARWPAAQAHLLAQSVAGLKLVTIAAGFDKDVPEIQPKRLRRLVIGPMYSSTFTTQTGPIREVLEGARSAPGDDWALAWTIEELESERTETDQGWFSTTEREVFRLDPLSPGGETGATRTQRNLILPQLPFQVLAERDPPGFRSVRKFVVGRDGRVVLYR